MATLADIAKIANVSVKTVANVLNGDRDLVRSGALKRATRIRQIAEDLGYRPNAAARATRAGKFGAVGILQAIESSRGVMPANTLHAIQVRVAERDMHLSMGVVPDFDLSDPAGLPKVLREWCVDGLLVSYTADLPPLMLEHIERHRIPAIWMNIRLEHDCVHLDDLGGALGATEALIGAGHRRIAFVGEGPDGGHYSIADRFEGYAIAMRRVGLQPYPVFRSPGASRCPNDAMRSIRELTALLRSNDRPTGIMTTVDMADVLFAAHLAGLSVPDDLSVVGLAEKVSPVFGVLPTHMRLHTYGLGWRAFGQLLQKLEQPDKPLETVAVLGTFERGGTLGPARH